MKKILKLFTVLICFVSTSFLAEAHHSRNASYEVDPNTVIEGEVTGVRWRNPHIRINIKVMENGKPTIWRLDLADAVSLRLRGVPKGLIKIGDHIKVAGRTGLRNKPILWARNILLADGREMLVYRVAPRWSNNTVGESDKVKTELVKRADGRADIFGVWVSIPGFDGDPDTGIWGGDIQLKAEAEAIRAKYDRADPNSPFLGCTRGFPELMAGFGPIKFIDNGDQIILQNEEFDMVRLIMMRPDAEANRPAPLPEAKDGDVGYAAGYWEGDTLVVRTTGMVYPYYDQTGLPQSREAEIVERWTPVDEGNAIRYELTVTDKTYYKKPIVQTTTWTWAPNREIQSYNCDLGFKRKFTK